MVRFALGCLLVLAACDMSPPEVSEFTPLEGEQMLGIGYVNVHVAYNDQTDVTAKLLVDNTQVEWLDPECSDDACTIDTIWDNTSLPAGKHTASIAIAGQQNPSSSGPYIGFDAVRVNGSAFTPKLSARAFGHRGSSAPE